MDVIGRKAAWIGAAAPLLVWTAWSQVTLKPVEGDPVHIDSGLVSGAYLPSGV
jgi:hypothetical protein